MNLSWGRPITQSYATAPLSPAVEAARKAGIVVVVAAGNGGRDNSSGPHLPPRRWLNRHPCSIDIRRRISYHRQQNGDN
jgi:subtilisin family serine protease